ncbi:hypothetical protein K439DRAFT_478526 [Ramaria rubella]|nr:hypothetical protein K439DRAFT_478526 [Ramaria rubella]
MSPICPYYNNCIDYDTRCSGLSLALSFHFVSVLILQGSSDLSMPIVKLFLRDVGLCLTITPLSLSLSFFMPTNFCLGSPSDRAAFVFVFKMAAGDGFEKSLCRVATALEVIGRCYAGEKCQYLHLRMRTTASLSELRTSLQSRSWHSRSSSICSSLTESRKTTSSSSKDRNWLPVGQFHDSVEERPTELHFLFCLDVVVMLGWMSLMNQQANKAPYSMLISVTVGYIIARNKIDNDSLLRARFRLS